MLHCKKFRTVKANHLAKYKIQLVFLAVSQRVGLYILLPLYLFRHAGAAYGRSLLFFCALLQQNRPLYFTENSYRASRLFYILGRYCSKTSCCALQRNLTGRAARCCFFVLCCSQTGRYTLQRILTGRAAAVYSVFLRYKIASMVVRWGCRPQLS